MSDEPKGWNEPTPQRLVEAMESYDHVRGGGFPRNPIENGLKLLMRIEQQQDVSLGGNDRARVVPALARAMDLNDELPKARVSSLMAARMIAVDVSLQRDAAIASDMDVLDRRQWWSPAEANARRPAWKLGSTNLGSAMLSLDERAHDAVAAGDLHAVPGRLGAKIKNAFEVVRSFGSGARADLDVDLMQATGAVSQDEAKNLKARLASREHRTEVIDRISAFSQQAETKDSRSWPDPDRRDRELSKDTKRVAYRLDDALRIAAAEPAPPLTRHEMKASRNAVSDAGFSNPETEGGVAVRIARTVLSDIGVDKSLLEGKEFERITASALRDSTSFVTHDVIPEMAATRIAAMTLLRDEADKRMARMDLEKGFPSGSQREAAFETMREAGIRNHELDLRVMLSGSSRDRTDLEAISQGRFDDLGDGLGMRSNVSNGLAAAGNSSKLATMVSSELSVVRTSREMESMRDVAGRPKVPMSKGPSSGREWITDVANFAKGLGSVSR